MSAEQTKIAEQESKNCLNCNKPIKKLKRYYREGKYYCSKKCWRSFKAKLKEGKT